jgi:hypothetical protein
LSDAAQNRAWARVDRVTRSLETWLIVVILGGLILLGAAQIVLRNFFSIGFPWVDGLGRLAVLCLIPWRAAPGTSRWAPHNAGPPRLRVAGRSSRCSALR